MNNNEKNKEDKNEEKVFEGIIEDTEKKGGGQKDKNKKDQVHHGSHHFRGSCCSRSSSGGGVVFGLFILFLGLFYLGKNLGWWNYQLNWTMIWPILIIFVGLSVMGGKRIVNWLLGIVLFFAIIVLLLSLLSSQRYAYNKKISNQLESEPINFSTNYSFKKYELVGDRENRFFSGYMSREEVERNVAEALDFMYQKADKDGKLDIELDIKRLIRREVE